MNKILVVAAHPDDEILGLGGTLIYHAQNGDEIFTLILGEGQTSRFNKGEERPNELLTQLQNDSLLANQLIGIKQVWFSDLPDNRFDQVDLLDIVKIIENKINIVKPNIIYTHFAKDLNLDHRLTFQAVLTASRPVHSYSVKEIYAFETLSSTEWNFGSDAFQPNVFTNIEQELERKLKALEYYKSEMCDYPHPRSLKGVETLARLRGMSVGMEAAEGFELVRMIR